MITVNFSDFWKGFNPQDNFFINRLRRLDTVELSDTPDILFYSAFGTRFLTHRGIRVFYTGENVLPDFSQCDYSFSFSWDGYGGRNCRLPLYLLESDLAPPPPRPAAADIVAQQRAFCNFVYSNPRAQRRIEFFKKLSARKAVDSGGKVCNNLGGVVEDKLSFLQHYKFTIAFENQSAPGYTTEKIFEPMVANSIPIYWGNPLIGQEFNTQSFINVHDFGSDEEAIERVLEIDANEQLYTEYLQRPWRAPNALRQEDYEQQVMAHLQNIVAAVAGTHAVGRTFNSRLRYPWVVLKSILFLKRHRYPWPLS